MLRILLALLACSGAAAADFSFDHPEKQVHKDYIMMFQGGNRGSGIDEAIEAYEAFISTATDIKWEIVDPVVNLYCEEQCAVVSIEYFMDWIEGDKNVESHGKNLIFFLKENGKWLMTAEHFSDIPPAK